MSASKRLLILLLTLPRTLLATRIHQFTLLWREREDGEEGEENGSSCFGCFFALFPAPSWRNLLQRELDVSKSNCKYSRTQIYVVNSAVVKKCPL